MGEWWGKGGMAGQRGDGVVGEIEGSESEKEGKRGMSSERGGRGEKRRKEMDGE